jgi:hypothetical protein
MKVEKRIHTAWKEIEELHKRGECSNVKHVVGKWQYIYSSPKGGISLIQLLNYGFLDMGDNVWEIYCLKCNLFDDVERFKNKKEAIQRIKDLLQEEVKT